MTATDKPTEPAQLLDVAGVTQLLNVSPRHVWRMADSGDFPRPLTIGAKLRRWPRSVVLAWIESRSAANPRR